MKNTRTMLLLALGATLVACNGNGSDEDDDVVTMESAGNLVAAPLIYRGANLAGAEFGVDPYGNGPLPGTFGVNYMYPDAAYATGYTSPDHFLSKGMTTFRLPFRWERLQPTRNAPLNAAELSRLTTTVSHLTAKGATVVLDPHNYARYGTAVIGSPALPSADFADLWSRLAGAFKSNPRVLFGLMNEPHDMPTEQWASAANAAITAIRGTGATNLILVPGNGWTGAESWAQTWYGTPNASAMLTITDPGNNFAFDVHQYLDNSGGTDPVCVSATIGSQRMAGLTTWLRANGRKAFLGEFGAGSSATCLAGLDDMLKHVETNSDVYLGWTYWAGGPWWGTNWMAVEPVAGADVPQMTTLLPHLAAAPAAASATCTDGIKNGSETGVDCGGSCAACPTSACQQTTVNASAMVPSIGAAVTGGWNLYSNGYMSTSLTVSAGQSTLTVNAKGSVAVGVWPHMVVSVDGTPIGNAFVNKTSWADYKFPLAAGVGSHQVRITFDNDFASTIEDRNLYVAKLVVGCGAAGTCVPTTCAATGKNCGSVSNGCGGTLSCGTCSASSTCGGGGVANVCGAATAVATTGTVRILPLGDSITLGVNGGYRNGLWSRLLTAGKSIDYVGSQLDPYAKVLDKDHEGHPGFTIGNISASANGWIQSAAPDFVLLMIGTNDVAWWCAQTGAQVADQNALLIDQILAARPSAWVVVASIPPLSSSIIQPNNVDRAQLGKDYNAALQQRVQTRIAAGKKVRFADVYSSLSVSDLYDGVHPTELAADKVAQVWYSALAPLLP